MKLFPHLIRDPDFVSSNYALKWHYKVTNILSCQVIIHLSFVLFPQNVEFSKYVQIPPFNAFKIDPVLYRIAVAITELCCASILIVGSAKLQKLANYVLVVLMLGALYTHFMVNDTPDKFGGAVVGLVLCLLRLYAFGYFKQDFIKIKIG